MENKTYDTPRDNGAANKELISPCRPARNIALTISDLLTGIQCESSATMLERSSAGLLRSTSRGRATGDETEEYGADS